MKNIAQTLLASFFSTARHRHHFPTVRSNSAGNRSKYTPAGPNKNTKPHNR